MAEVFASAIDGNKDGVVYAVASRSLGKAVSFAANHGHCKAYGSYSEMLIDVSLQIDVIYIATPVKYHYEIIKQCLLAGKNVLCEKPICFDASQLYELQTLAREKNCFLTEGMWMKCLPSFRKAQEWINEKRIGTLNLIKVDFYKRERIRPELPIFNSSEGGGVLRDYGVYAIAFITSFMKGLPTTIHSSSRCSSFGIDSDWQIYAEKDGIRAFVNLSSNFASLSKAIVVGDKGSIEWSSPFNRTNKVTLFDPSGLNVDEFLTNYDYEGFEYEVNEVQACIKAGRKESGIISISDSMATLQTIDKILESTTINSAY